MAKNSVVKHSRTIKLFAFLPIYSWKEHGSKKKWKILGIPVLLCRKKANGNTSKYYFLGIPVMKVSKKLM